MTRIDLLRHGSTDHEGCYCGSLDTGLSIRGWRQMSDATSGREWDRIISSPLRRCAAFAADLAARLSVPVSYDDRLREMHFGDWEGRRTEELLLEDRDAVRGFWSDPLAFPPPNAETLGALQIRVLALWQQLARESEPERTLLITHGGPIRILIAHYRRLPLSGLHDIDVPHAGLFSLPLPETLPVHPESRR